MNFQLCESLAPVITPALFNCTAKVMTISQAIAGVVFPTGGGAKFKHSIKCYLPDL